MEWKSKLIWEDTTLARRLFLLPAFVLEDKGRVISFMIIANDYHYNIKTSFVQLFARLCVNSFFRFCRSVRVAPNEWGEMPLIYRCANAAFML